MLWSRLVLVCLMALFFVSPIQAASKTVFEQFTLDAPIPDTFKTNTLYKLSGVAAATASRIEFRWEPTTTVESLVVVVPQFNRSLIREFNGWFIFSKPGVYRFWILSQAQGESLDSAWRSPKQEFRVTVVENTAPAVLPSEDFFNSYFGRLKFAQPVVQFKTTVKLPLLTLDLRGKRSKAKSIELSVYRLLGQDVSPVFRDDGSNGDLVAGDSIYSVQLPDCEVSSPICVHTSLRSFIAVAGVAEFFAAADVVYENGEREYFSTNLGLLSSDIQRVSLEQLSPTVFKTDNLVNIVDTSGTLIAGLYSGMDLQKIAARFYQYFPDRFDMLFFRLGRFRNDGLEGYYVPVSTPFTGTGRTVSNGSAGYGSASKLQGAMYLNFASITPQIHELMHHWANHIPLHNAGNGSHWGISNVNGVLGGDVDFSKVTSLGNNEYSVPWPQGVGSTFAGKYGKLELYLAGLLPASEVPPVTLLKNPELVRQVRSDSGQIVAQIYRSTEGIRTYTIDDLIRELGPRTPAFGAAQTHFKAATVVVTSSPMDQLTATWISQQIQLLASNVEHDYAFAAATGYRATLDASLGNPLAVSITGGSRTVTDTNDVRGETVTLTATATNKNGSLASTEWLVAGRVVATGTTASIALPDGVTGVTFKATDTSGATNSTQATITVANVNTQRSDWLGSINSVAPDKGFEPGINSVGLILGQRARVHSCVKIYDQGKPIEIGGAHRIEVTFRIVSLDQGLIQLIASRPFVESSQSSESRTDCSGSFERSTGVYRDLLKLDSRLFDARFTLANEALLEFTLTSAQELARQ